jgi:hemerythrin
MILEWNDKYKTNIIEIDTQHQRLFILLANLVNLYSNNKGKLVPNVNAIKKSISELEQYALSHFLIEERIMEENDYPDLENHKAVHDKFTDKILEIKKLFLDENVFSDESKLDDLIKTVLSFLEAWLINHIMVQDMEYKPFIKHMP